MEKYLAAAWCGEGEDSAPLHDWLERAWLPARLADPALRGLALRRRLPEQKRGPDALASLWLDGDPRPAADALRERAARVELWRVTEHRRKRQVRGWPEGAPTPGFAMVALMCAAPGRSAAECQRYWCEQHTGLALRVHQGMAAYVQNVVAEALTPGGADVIGVAELWFRTRADYTDRFYVPPEARHEIAADVRRFASLERSVLTEMTELVARAIPGTFA